MKNVRNYDDEILYDRIAWKVKRIVLEASSSDGKSVAWSKDVLGPVFKSRTRYRIFKRKKNTFVNHFAFVSFTSCNKYNFMVQSKISR